MSSGTKASAMDTSGLISRVPHEGDVGKIKDMVILKGWLEAGYPVYELNGKFVLLPISFGKKEKGDRNKKGSLSNRDIAGVSFQIREYWPEIMKLSWDRTAGRNLP